VLVEILSGVLDVVFLGKFVMRGGDAFVSHA
jgi:hypothetical protein